MGRSLNGTTVRSCLDGYCSILRRRQARTAVEPGNTVKSFDDGIVQAKYMETFKNVGDLVGTWIIIRKAWNMSREARGIPPPGGGTASGDTSTDDSLDTPDPIMLRELFMLSTLICWNLLKAPVNLAAPGERLLLQDMLRFAPVLTGSDLYFLLNFFDHYDGIDHWARFDTMHELEAAFAVVEELDPRDVAPMQVFTADAAMFTTASSLVIFLLGSQSNVCVPGNVIVDLLDSALRISLGTDTFQTWRNLIDTLLTKDPTALLVRSSCDDADEEDDLVEAFTILKLVERLCVRQELILRDTLSSLRLILFVSLAFLNAISETSFPYSLHTQLTFTAPSVISAIVDFLDVYKEVELEEVPPLGHAAVREIRTQFYRLLEVDQSSVVSSEEEDAPPPLATFLSQCGAWEMKAQALSELLAREPRNDNEHVHLLSVLLTWLSVELKVAVTAQPSSLSGERTMTRILAVQLASKLMANLELDPGFLQRHEMLEFTAQVCRLEALAVLQSTRQALNTAAAEARDTVTLSPRSKANQCPNSPLPQTPNLIDVLGQEIEGEDWSSAAHPEELTTYLSFVEVILFQCVQVSSSGTDRFSQRLIALILDLTEQLAIARICGSKGLPLFAKLSTAYGDVSDSSGWLFTRPELSRRRAQAAEALIRPFGLDGSQNTGDPAGSTDVCSRVYQESYLTIGKLNRAPIFTKPEEALGYVTRIIRTHSIVPRRAPALVINLLAGVCVIIEKRVGDTENAFPAAGVDLTSADATATTMAVLEWSNILFRKLESDLGKLAIGIAGLLKSVVIFNRISPGGGGRGISDVSRTVSSLSNIKMRAMEMIDIVDTFKLLAYAVGEPVWNALVTADETVAVYSGITQGLVKTAAEVCWSKRLTAYIPSAEKAHIELGLPIEALSCVCSCLESLVLERGLTLMREIAGVKPKQSTLLELCKIGICLEAIEKWVDPGNDNSAEDTVAEEANCTGELGGEFSKRRRCESSSSSPLVVANKKVCQDEQFTCRRRSPFSRRTAMSPGIICGSAISSDRSSLRCGAEDAESSAADDEVSGFSSSSEFSDEEEQRSTPLGSSVLREEDSLDPIATGLVPSAAELIDRESDLEEFIAYSEEDEMDGRQKCNRKRQGTTRRRSIRSAALPASLSAFVKRIFWDESLARRS